MTSTNRHTLGARELPSIRLLGVRIDSIRRTELLEVVDRAVRDRSRLDVFYVNAHCMNVAEHDAEYRVILEGAGLVYCDGTGVRLAARLLGKFIPERMTGADWIGDLARVAVIRKYSLYLLGGSEGSAAEAAEALRRAHPGLKIAGTRAGFELGHAALEDIRAARPDILLVGMGTPRQEKWISEHHTELDVPVLWAVGALFDFVSGRLWRGPRWMTEHGLEWACRLAIEPRKLWRRYLIGNPKFLWRVLLARLWSE